MADLAASTAPVVSFVSFSYDQLRSVCVLLKLPTTGPLEELRQRVIDYAGDVGISVSHNEDCAAEANLLAATSDGHEKKPVACYSVSPKADHNNRHTHNTSKEVKPPAQKRQKTGVLDIDDHPLPEEKALEHLICPISHVRAFRTACSHFLLSSLGHLSHTLSFFPRILHNNSTFRSTQ